MIMHVIFMTIKMCRNFCLPLNAQHALSTMSKHPRLSNLILWTWDFSVVSVMPLTYLVALLKWLSYNTTINSIH